MYHTINLIVFLSCFVSHRCRGEYVAGTENSRLVTVTGDPECVSRAIGRINRLLK